ncbi:MAG TPA: M42 family metallopeptidase [Firmicutes bacterium]|nr:M42 family metallopeptidase [Bacillota bacterium]
MVFDVGYQTGDVEPGDPVVFAANARWLGEDRKVLASKAIDDRVGCAILVRVAQLLPDRTRNTVLLVGSVQEDVGGFGARYVAGVLACAFNSLC